MENSDSEDDVLKEVRMRYAEDLEEILECPVCFEIPIGTIYLCMQGHATCQSCRVALINRGEPCPICQSKFSSCRNIIAENICSKFRDIKSSILDPRHGSNRRILKNVVSVQVQTDNISDKNENKYVSVYVQTDDNHINQKTTETQTTISKSNACSENNNKNINFLNGNENDCITSDNEDIKDPNVATTYDDGHDGNTSLDDKDYEDEEEEVNSLDIIEALQIDFDA